LLEYETLTGPESMKVINGEPLGRGDDDSDTPAPPRKIPSLTAIPKAGSKDRPLGGTEPQPSPTA
jgi:cell division protease FtsH